VLGTFEEVRHLLGNGMQPVLHQGQGCDECNQTGYHGRIALFEALTCTQAIRQAVEGQASPDAIERQALADGMVPLRMWAKVAVAEGVTTLEEAMRVIDMQM